jgi:hypothetical protein
VETGRALRGITRSQSSSSTPTPSSSTPRLSDPNASIDIHNTPVSTNGFAVERVPNTSSEILLSGTVEFNEIQCDKTEPCLVMASLKAPTFSDSQRSPVALSFVVDRSGSMAGEKMALMKKALTFVVERGLQPQDYLSVVVYDTTVTVQLAWTNMSSAGKAQALKVIENMTTRGQPNLSGGLMEGLKLVKGCPPSCAVASVLLFTDGQANVGLVAVTDITRAMASSISDKTAVFTFGFGANHGNHPLLAGWLGVCVSVCLFVCVPSLFFPVLLTGCSLRPHFASWYLRCRERNVLLRVEC